MPHAYTEDQFVDQSAIGLSAKLGSAKIPKPRRTHDLFPRLLSGQINLTN